jgi:hypothetical protein
MRKVASFDSRRCGSVPDPRDPRENPDPDEVELELDEELRELVLDPDLLDADGDDAGWEEALGLSSDDPPYPAPDPGWDDGL